jgi:hypothetical protein
LAKSLSSFLRKEESSEKDENKKEGKNIKQIASMCGDAPGELMILRKNGCTTPRMMIRRMPISSGIPSSLHELKRQGVKMRRRIRRDFISLSIIANLDA